MQEKYAGSEDKHIEENAKLTEEYKRLAEAIEHQQEKQDSFHCRNAQTFSEVHSAGCEKYNLSAVSPPQ